MIQEPTTNNLVVLSESLEFIKLDSGKQQCIFRKLTPPVLISKPNTTGETQDSQARMAL